MSEPEPPAGAPATPETKKPIIEPEVLALGVVSFFTDMSSELIFGILPTFLTSILKATPLELGLMEGLADFASCSLDLASGWLSDRTGRRKAFAVVGYGLSSVAKLVLPFAGRAYEVVAFRSIERLGKSIRGAPRDALLASIASHDKKGTAFGVHKALDRAGAIVGPVIAFALLRSLGSNEATFRKLFWIAVAPAFLSIAILLVAVRERRDTPHARRSLRESLKGLGPAYWRYMVAASVFSLAYFSFSFLLLNATRVGFGDEYLPLLYASLNVVATLVSVPLGALGDRIGRRSVITFGFGVYGAMLAILFLVPTKVGAVASFLLYGVFLAVDEGQTKAYITDLSGKERRGSAIGAYNFLTGLIYFPASLLAGYLWKSVSPDATFITAGVITAIAAALFVLLPPPAPKLEKA